MIIKITIVVIMMILIYQIAILWGILIGGFRKQWHKNKWIMMLNIIMVLFVTTVAVALVAPTMQLWRLME